MYVYVFVCMFVSLCSTVFQSLSTYNKHMGIMDGIGLSNKYILNTCYRRQRWHCICIDNIYLQRYVLLYSRKVWQGECLANLLFPSVWQKSLANEYISQKVINLKYKMNGFSLANHGWLAKFAKLSYYMISIHSFHIKGSILVL